MIGLLFLGATLLWFGFTVYLTQPLVFHSWDMKHSAQKAGALHVSRC